MHVHQPKRIRPYTVFETANDHNYFDNPHWDHGSHNRKIFRKVAEKSYLPTNAILLELLNQHPEFRFSLSITGTLLEQAEMWGEDVLQSFQRLTETGRVEIVAETYHHSLAFFYSRSEFEAQVGDVKERIKNNLEVKGYFNC